MINLKGRNRFMDVLLFILFVVCLVALVIGLVKPGVVVRWGAEEKKNRKSVLKYYGIGTLVFFILFSVNVSNSTTTNNTASKSASATITAQDQAIKDKKVAADLDAKIIALGNVNYLTLDKLADVNSIRTEYNDTLTTTQKKLVTKLETLTTAEKKITDLQATELQKVEYYDTGITYNQLSRTPDSYEGQNVKFTGTVIQVMEDNGKTDLRIAVDGNYDTILLVVYDSSITSIRVLENDTVTIKGVSQGLYTYESTLGGNITMPLVNADILTIS